MTVSINDTIVRIFAGARLQDALRRYIVETGMPTEMLYRLDDYVTARDRFGNIVALTSPLKQNRKFTITFNTTPNDEKIISDI